MDLYIVYISFFYFHVFYDFQVYILTLFVRQILLKGGCNRITVTVYTLARVALTTQYTDETKVLNYPEFSLVDLVSYQPMRCLHTFEPQWPPKLNCPERSQAEENQLSTHHHKVTDLTPYTSV